MQVRKSVRTDRPDLVAREIQEFKERRTPKATHALESTVADVERSEFGERHAEQPRVVANVWAVVYVKSAERV